MKHKSEGDNGGLSKALTHRGCTGAAARHRGEDGGQRGTMMSSQGLSSRKTQLCYNT